MKKFKGCIYRRGKTWWLTFYTNPKTENEKPVKQFISLGTGDKAAAQAKAETLMMPFSLSDEADRARAIEQTTISREQKAMDAAKQAEAERNRLPIDQVWTQFPYDHTSPNRKTRRKLSPLNIDQNRVTWVKFTKWLAAAHPEVKYLEEVTQAHAAAFSKQMTDTEHLTAGRHNKVIMTCKVMFRLAGRMSPFDAVKNEDGGITESRVNLEEPELINVIQSASGELRRLFVIAVYTGLRLGDAVLLRWSSIRNGQIFKVGADRTRKTGKELVLPMVPNLVFELDKVPVEERGEYVCPELAEIYIRQRTHLSRIVGNHFKKVCGLVTLEEGENRKNRISRRGFHSFRHSFISECARKNVPMGMIRDWVGHSSEEITKIYEHYGHKAGNDKILSALPVLAGAFIGASAAVESVSADQLRRRITKAMKTADHGALQRALAALDGGTG